jgi:hypothetical protein
MNCFESFNSMATEVTKRVKERGGKYRDHIYTVACEYTRQFPKGVEFKEVMSKIGKALQLRNPIKKDNEELKKDKQPKQLGLPGV